VAFFVMSGCMASLSLGAMLDTMQSPQITSQKRDGLRSSREQPGVVNASAM
jgi:hypothetical protein